MTMENVTLSIVIPCFNERENIIQILDKVDRAEIPNKEIIVVDDMSTDGTRDILGDKDGELTKSSKKDDSPDTGDLIHPKYIFALGLAFAAIAVFFKKKAY